MEDRLKFVRVWIVSGLRSVELQAGKAGIEPILRRKTCVGPLFHDPAALHHDDAVCRAYGGEPVRNHQCCAGFHQPI